MPPQTSQSPLAVQICLANTLGLKMAIHIAQNPDNQYQKAVKPAHRKKKNERERLKNSLKCGVLIQLGMQYILN